MAGGPVAGGWRRAVDWGSRTASAGSTRALSRGRSSPTASPVATWESGSATERAQRPPAQLQSSGEESWEVAPAWAAPSPCPACVPADPPSAGPESIRWPSGPAPWPCCPRAPAAARWCGHSGSWTPATPEERRIPPRRRSARRRSMGERDRAKVQTSRTWVHTVANAGRGAPPSLDIQALKAGRRGQGVGRSAPLPHRPSGDAVPHPSVTPPAPSRSAPAPWPPDRPPSPSGTPPAPAPPCGGSPRPPPARRGTA